MERNLTGKLARSKSGHDQNQLYVIVREEEKCVFVADGRLKTLENPKKKNKKHIQIINQMAIELIKTEPQIREEKIVRNEDIKRAIKLYRHE